MSEITVTYNNKSYIVDSYFYTSHLLKGISNNRADELLAKAIDSNLPLTKDIVEKLYKAEHEQKADKFISSYKLRGTLKGIPLTCDETTRTELINKFKNDNRFHGRSPRIIDAICIISDLYAQTALTHSTEADNSKELLKNEIQDILVSKFSIPTVRTMLNNKVPECLVVMLYERYTPEKCLQITNDIDTVHDICSLLLKAHKKDIKYLGAADWIANHLETNKAFTKKILKSVDRISITPLDTIDAVDAKISNLKALKEVEKVEKAYKKPKFKFEECTCELKGVGVIVEDDKYISYIMKADDERQLILGYETDCCQVLSDAGESAMMHGLLNPKAGFWVVEEKSTGKIKAQAEIWEENENILVFDNIEFANDADISLYREVIRKWLLQTEYPSVKMGVAYNAMFSDDFSYAPAAKPTVTPREIYVISYEEDSEAPCFSSEEEAKYALENGEVTYYDYIYCDSENSSVWMKKDNVLEPYFISEEEERIMQKKIKDLATLEKPLIRLYAAHLNEVDIEKVNEFVLATNHENSDNIVQNENNQMEEDECDLEWVCF